MADKVVELARSPASVRSPTSPKQNGDVDDVFLFDNNIPSIATRIPSSAEPADALDLRRRNRLLRLISEPRLYGCSLQRSVSVQLDDRRRQQHHSDDHGFSTSWTNGGHLVQHPNRIDVDDDDDEVDRALDSAAESYPSLMNGMRCGVRRMKKMRSVDACCSGSSGGDAALAKRRSTLAAVKPVCDEEDLNVDGDNDDQLPCHQWNGVDTQLSNNISATQCSKEAK